MNQRTKNEASRSIKNYIKMHTNLGLTQKMPSSYFDKIDQNLVQKAAKKTKGAAGP